FASSPPYRAFRPLRSCFLVLPRPPRATLFPYTTLFRSTKKSRLKENFQRLSKPYRENRIRTCDPLVPNQVLYQAELFPVNNEQIDRKSTRLNSSHVSISYAVFCLKKKIPKYTREYADHN